MRVEGGVDDMGGERLNHRVTAVEGQCTAGGDDLEGVAAGGLADRVAKRGGHLADVGDQAARGGVPRAASVRRDRGAGEPFD